MSKILKGKERRELRDQIAFARAQFERDYAGLPLVPFERSEVCAGVPDKYRGGWNGTTIQIMISDAFVKECQRRVPYMRKLIEDYPEGPS